MATEKLVIKLVASDALFSLNDILHLLERMSEQIGHAEGARPCPMCSGKGTLGQEPTPPHE